MTQTLPNYRTTLKNQTVTDEEMTTLLNNSLYRRLNPELYVKEQLPNMQQQYEKIEKERREKEDLFSV
jgi:hypothetical protein